MSVSLYVFIYIHFNYADRQLGFMLNIGHGSCKF